MSFPSSQRLARWSALAVLALGGASCGNDTPDLATGPERTTVAFTAPTHLGVNDVREGGGPRLAVGQGATFIALWSDGLDIAVERSTDGGAHWSAPIVVDAGGRGFAPDLVCDRHGVCLAVWKAVSLEDGEHGENDVFAARSADDGATWSAAVRLGRPDVFEGFNTDPAIATDGRGEWVVVWDALDAPEGQIKPSPSRIEAVTSSDGGSTWSAHSVVSTTNEGSRYVPRIAADDAGNYLVTFSAIDGDPQVFEADNRVFAARSSDGREWSTPIRVGAGDLRPSMKEGNGDVAFGGDGTWHVVFTTQRPDEEHGGFFLEVLAARSVDGGATWGTPQQLDTPGASTVDIFPNLAADADGHVVAVWVTYLQANSLHLLTVQSADAGKTWSAPSKFPGGAGNPQLDGLPDVDLATDGAGRWSAVWALASPGSRSINEPHDVVVARGVTTAD